MKKLYNFCNEQNLYWCAKKLSDTHYIVAFAKYPVHERDLTSMTYILYDELESGLLRIEIDSSKYTDSLDELFRIIERELIRVFIDGNTIL